MGEPCQLNSHEEKNRRFNHAATPEELARMTFAARKLCEMVGKYPTPRDLTLQEIELLRASKRELAALAFARFARADT